MTDQPSPALAEAREAVAAMTAKPFIGVVIEGDDTPPILFSHEDNVAGANRAVALLRTTVAEETVERLALVISCVTWGNETNEPMDGDRRAARAVITALLERAREGT